MRDILFYIWLILTDCLPGILGKPVSPTAIFIWAGSTCTQTWHPPQDAVFREIIGHQRPLNAIPSTLQSLTKSSPVFVSKQSNMLREHLFWTTGISERRCHCKNAAQNNSTYLSMLSCKTNIHSKTACFGLLIRSQKYKYHRAFMCLHDANQQSSFLWPFIFNISLCREAYDFSALLFAQYIVLWFALFEPVAGFRIT